MCILRRYGGDVRRYRWGGVAGVEFGEDRHFLLAVLTNGVACAATEYYLGVGEAPGRCHGRGLAELGLTVGGTCR